jgi:chaperonin cofactor prefoldin
MAEEKKQSVTDMVKELTEKSETLRSELMDLEKEFNLKKEEFIKIQGALEAFQIVQSPNVVVS